MKLKFPSIYAGFVLGSLWRLPAIALLALLSFLAPSASWCQVPGGSISGSVYRSNGTTPIVNAHVSALAGDPLELVAETSTGSGGFFRLQGLPSGAYIVKVEATGWLSEFWQEAATLDEATPVSVTAPDETAHIGFTLDWDHGSISGYVYEDDGSTMIMNAHVSVYDWETGQLCGGADTHPVYGYFWVDELPPGGYYVKAEAPGWPAEYWQDAATPGDAHQVTVTAPDETSINFFVGVGGSISGHVFETDGMTPIPGAWVSAWNYDVGGNTSSTWTDDNGFYRVLDLPSGVYGVEAYAEGRTWEVWEESLGLEAATPVTVVAPEQTADIDFTLEMVGSISGYVYDEDAHLLPDAYVMVYDCDTNLPKNGANTVDGFYRVEGLPVGDYYVKAVAMGRIPEYWEEAATRTEAKKVTVIALGESKNINFTLRTGGSISGHIYTAESQVPIANASVTVQDFTTFEDFGVFYTGLDGAYLLTGLPTGQYLVTSGASNRVPQFWQGASTVADADPVPVTDPDETADIDFFMDKALPPGPQYGSISGYVYESDGVTPIAGATVQCAAGPTSGHDFSDNAGYFRITDLNPGTYLLRAEASERVTEYWRESPAQAGAEQVVVNALAETAGIDFTLDLVPGSISGYVYEDDGSTMIMNAHVSVYDWETGQLCGGADTHPVYGYF